PPTPTLFPYTTLFRSVPALLRLKAGPCRGLLVDVVPAADQTRRRRARRRREVDKAPVLGTDDLEVVARDLHRWGRRIGRAEREQDRKSTRLNSSHDQI